MITKNDISKGLKRVTSESFKEVFQEQYNLLYNASPEEARALSVSAGGVSLVDCFDVFMQKSDCFRFLVRLCCSIRQDAFSSDRECIAFLRTINILGVEFTA